MKKELVLSQLNLDAFATFSFCLLQIPRVFDEVWHK